MDTLLSVMYVLKIFTFETWKFQTLVVVACKKKNVISIFFYGWYCSIPPSFYFVDQGASMFRYLPNVY